MQITQFRFKGMQEYEAVQEKIYQLVYLAFQGNVNYEYQQAIEEAVCNAAQYSVDGPIKAEIFIKVRQMPLDIAVTVSAETRPFDAFAYQARLQRLLKIPSIAKLDWGDYVADMPASSGFWYMLTGCDYLYVDNNGEAVTLVAKTVSSYSSAKGKTTSLSDIIPRFLIRKNGVIR